MAIALTGGGGLFDRLGLIFGGLDDINALRGGAATARVLSTADFNDRRDALFAEYADGTPLASVIDGVDADLVAWKKAQQRWFTSMKTLAQDTLIAMADADAPLSSKTVAAAMKELIKQMASSGDDVNASAPSAGSASAVGSPTGNPQFVFSVSGGSGVNREYILAETMRIEVTSDAYGAGTATARNEAVKVTGAALQSDTFSELWPDGSGANKSLNLTDSMSDNGTSGNLLVNSSFETFTTSNKPDNWITTANSTVAGTHLIKEDSVIYGDGGAHSLQIKGDGSVLVTLRQQFDTTSSTTADSGGSPQVLAARTPYAVGFWCRNDSNPAAGVLRVALVDGSGNVINDDNGTANSFTVTLTSLGTSFVFKQGVFRLPAAVPSTVYLEFKTTTAQTSGRITYIDGLALAKMTELYTGGPYMAAFAASTNPAVGDRWTVAMSNTQGAMQAWFERCFGMRALGLQLPSDTGGSETVADSLIA